MPRSPRIIPEEGLFHILTRGNNRQAVFHERSDFEAYLALLARLQRIHPFKLYHYCLMTNHVHLLLETTPGHPLSRTMKKLNLTYALYYKKKYSHIGHFWQDRFKSLLIEKDLYLMACAAYIELNPVKAGIVRDPADHPYSSFSFYAAGTASSLLTPNPLYETFGDTEDIRRANYREFVLGRLEDYELFEKQALGKRALGSENFLQCLKARFKVFISRRPPGRPKKDSTEHEIVQK